MISRLIAATLIATVFASATHAQKASSELVQTDEHVLVANLRQKPVYAADRAGLGEIKDVLIDRTGAVKAVLIDVGQGRTQRLIALPMNALDIRNAGAAAPEPGRLEVFLAISREEFDRAPVFRTADRLP